MTYNTIADMQADGDLRRRLVASAAQEGKPVPDNWVNNNIWQIVSAPGWSEAWNFAQLQGVTNPGHREDVITDAMILAVVQPMQ